MQTAGKTALVTGGAAGIGRTVAERLSADGARVAVADRDERHGTETAQRLGGLFIEADLAERSSVEPMMRQAVSQLGGLDILINNAGGGGSGPYYPQAGPEAWAEIIDVNLHALMRASQLAIESMTGRGGGAIVNIASVAGLGGVAHAMPEYAAAKAAVVRLTTASAHLRDTIGVRMNCICPDMVDTPSSRGSRAAMNPEELAALAPVIDPRDIADAVTGLLADDALTGRVLVCPGGAPPFLLSVQDWSA